VITTCSLGRTRAATISAVIILVKLAIGSTRFWLRRHSTRPVLTSNSSPLDRGSFRCTETRWAAGASVRP